MHNTPHQFSNIELVSHRKEIGTNPNLTGEDPEEAPKRKRADRLQVDDDGFNVVVRK